MTKAKMTPEKAVNKYIQLREAKAKIKSIRDKELEIISDAMDRLEGHLMKFMNESGTTSLKCRGGTAYITTKKSATVNDWPAFLAHVQNTGEWDLLNRSCSKTAVVERVDSAEGVPPGLNYVEINQVNIRK